MPAITRFVLRHKALVALFWVVVAAAGVMTIGGTTHRMTNNFAMPGQAFKVDNQITRQYGNGGSQTPYLPVITVPAGQKVTEPAVAAATGRAFAAVARAIPGARIADYATTGNRAFVTSDGRSTFAYVYTAPVAGFGGPSLGPVLQRTVAAAVPAGWHVGVTGMQLLENGQPSSSKGTGIMAEAMIGSVGALVILALVFASFLALLPLLIGGISVLATFLVVGGLTEVTGVSQIVEFLIALIGLGVAIDYSLLVVSRWREERAAGRSNADAVAEAMNHAGRAVVFSGLTVAIGLLSMIVLPVPMLRSVGYGGVLVPLVSVVVAVTLLPVILATVGPRLDWPRLRTERRASRVFSSWARGVYRHRWLAALAGLGILAALMLPALSLHLGEPGSSAQATSGPAHGALVTLTDGGVPSGALTPAEVLVSSSPVSVASSAARVPGVYAAVAPATPDYHRNGTAIVTVLPVAESSVPSGQATIAGLEHALLGRPGVIGVGGDGASLIDFDHAVYGDFPLMLALIGVATFLLLTRAFRSVLLAAKAVVFNLISLAAAYGVLTWVWQDGHGSGALWGIPATGAITMWVPLMVFAFLFGLSMDYEVFILTRIREAYDASGDARHAVTEGLGRTGRLVTSAAAILMLSFLSMSTGPQTDLKILATGLGAGILIDAVIVRCLLVPALVALFGRANWWLPSSLARLLRIPAAAPALAGAGAGPAAAGPGAAGAEGSRAGDLAVTGTRLRSRRRPGQADHRLARLRLGSRPAVAGMGFPGVAVRCYAARSRGSPQPWPAGADPAKAADPGRQSGSRLVASRDYGPAGRHPSALRPPRSPAVAWLDSPPDGCDMNAAGALISDRGHGRAWPVPRLLVIVAVLGLAAASCGGPPPPASAPSASSPSASSLTVKSCTVDGQAARCGTLIVPENRLTGQGRTIPVRFVVFPAAGPDRAPDPLVFFAGGPGDSAITDSSTWLPVLQNLNLGRDLVFIEQRGTGQSSPLNCPAFPSTLADKAALRASVESCLASLHGDLRFYTTAMFTDDVSQILTALHYAKADLIGGSYGPTAEQVFLLRHPGQVRTMTMLNGTLLTIPMFEREPGNTQRALDQVFALCQRQPACHQAFPRLAADWAALWASLGRSPWVLPAAQSPTGKTERLDQDTLAGMMYQALHTSEIGPIPVVIHTLGTATDKLAAWLSVAKALQAAGLGGAGGSTTTPMMQYEIMCAEPWAANQPAALSDQRGSFAYQGDLETAQWYQYICPLIPTSAAAVGSQQLTASPVPVLAFSGAADPNDQPRNMAGAEQFWPGSRAIALPSQGHSFSSANGWDCESTLIQAFIQQASAARLDTGCLAGIPAPAFPLTLQALAGGG